ncbi:MAG: polysaccharide biosynthesis/export family protein, partial [Acidobacteriaceae bacterium]
MTQPSTFAGAVHLIRSAYCARMSRVALFAMASMLMFFFITEAPANGQAPFASTSTQSLTQPSGSEGSRVATPMTDDSENSGEDRDGLTNTGGLATSRSLSSDQIINLLQQNPDLVVELKSQVADRMQEQGKQIDANDISDEMLYDQIATNADLRANITIFLCARGYIFDDDLQTAASSVSDGSEEPGLSSAQGALTQPGDTNKPFATLGVNAGSRMDRSGLPGASTQSSTRSIRSTNNGQRFGEKRGHEEVNASTDAPQVLRKPTPYNLQSMRDLYTQIPDRTARLKRFGSEVFENRDVYAARGISSHDTPLDVPLGPDYVVGPGDTLTIDMWGGITKSITRVVDRDGRVLLPEAGSLQVAGLP